MQCPHTFGSNKFMLFGNYERGTIDERIVSQKSISFTADFVVIIFDGLSQIPIYARVYDNSAIYISAS